MLFYLMGKKEKTNIEYFCPFSFIMPYYFQPSVDLHLTLFADDTPFSKLQC